MIMTKTERSEEFDKRTIIYQMKYIKLQKD